MSSPEKPFQDIKKLLDQCWLFRVVGELLYCCVPQGLLGLCGAVTIQLSPLFCLVSFLFVIEHMMPLCMVISWVYSVAMMIQHIVTEKEHRLKEVRMVRECPAEELVSLRPALCPWICSPSLCGARVEANADFPHPCAELLLLSIPGISCAQQWREVILLAPWQRMLWPVCCQ